MGQHRRERLDLEAYIDKSQKGPCFICEIVAGVPGRPEPVVYRDSSAIAFLARYPALLGHVLVAPLDHREDVVASFSQAEYLSLQSLVYRVGKAVASVLPTERLYVLSLGSKQGNAHVHWHVAPLPPGVPYENQQFRALMVEGDGYLVVPPEEGARLAHRIGLAMRPDEPAHGRGNP